MATQPAAATAAASASATADSAMQTNADAASPDVASDPALAPASVHVEPMLKAEAKYFSRIRHLPSMRLPRYAGVAREDLPLSDARAFLLHGLLSPNECAHYIRETEEMVYRDLSREFAEEYRSNQRILVLSPALSDMIWRRMEPHLTRSDVVRIRPMCFGNGGAWRPFRLNECFKFGRYRAREHFSTHIDGPWVPRDDESSIYTVLVYLNSDFTGGRTVFLPQEGKERVDASIAAIRAGTDRSEMEYAQSLLDSSSPSSSSGGRGFHEGLDGTVSVYPATGVALVFTHDALHAGLPVASGAKYVLRTEIMFRRVDTPSIPVGVREAHLADPSYARTIKLYADCYAQGQRGDVAAFTNSYLQALRLQSAAQRSVSADTRALHLLALPAAVYIHAFTFLPLSALGATLRANKAHRELAMDGSLWKQMFRAHFPAQSVAQGIVVGANKAKRERAAAAAATTAGQDAPMPMEDATMEPERAKREEKTDGPSAATAASSKSPSPLLAWTPLSAVNSSRELLEGDDDSGAPDEAALSDDGFGPIDPATQDWATLFRQRWRLGREFGAVVFDLGSYRSCCATLSPDQPVLELESIVSSTPGLTDMHARMNQYARWFVGSSARGRSALHVMHAVSRGRIASLTAVVEIVAAFFVRLSLWSHEHPVVIVLPGGGSWGRKDKRDVTRAMLRVFRSPAVAFVDAGVLALLHAGKHTGLVLSVGQESAWVSAVVRGRRVGGKDLSPSDSPNASWNARQAQKKAHWDFEGDAEYSNPLDDAAVDRPHEHRPRNLCALLDPAVVAKVLRECSDEALKYLHDLSSVPEIGFVLCVGGGILTEEGREWVRAVERHAGADGMDPRLELVASTEPIHAPVLGGRVFAGLSAFKYACVGAMDAAVALSLQPSSDPLRPGWMEDPNGGDDDGLHRDDHRSLAFYADRMRVKSNPRDEWMAQLALFTWVRKCFEWDELGRLVSRTAFTPAEVKTVVTAAAKGGDNPAADAARAEDLLFVWRRAGTGVRPAAAPSSGGSLGYREGRQAFLSLPHILARWVQRQEYLRCLRADKPPPPEGSSVSMELDDEEVRVVAQWTYSGLKGQQARDAAVRQAIDRTPSMARDCWILTGQEIAAHALSAHQYPITDTLDDLAIKGVYKARRDAGVRTGGKKERPTRDHAEEGGQVDFEEYGPSHSRPEEFATGVLATLPEPDVSPTEGPGASASANAAPPLVPMSDDALNALLQKMQRSRGDESGHAIHLRVAAKVRLLSVGADLKQKKTPVGDGELHFNTCKLKDGKTEARMLLRLKTGSTCLLSPLVEYAGAFASEKDACTIVTRDAADHVLKFLIMLSSEAEVASVKAAYEKCLTLASSRAKTVEEVD